MHKISPDHAAKHRSNAGSATRTRMLRLTLLGFGVGLLAVGCFFLLIGFSGGGFLNAELHSMTQTGLPLNPHELVWSEWRPNDGSVIPLNTFHREQQPPSLPEFRVAHRKVLFFDFAYYQGRYERNGDKHEFPALGPGMLSYSWIWGWLSLLFGFCFLFAARFARQPSSSTTASCVRHSADTSTL